MITYNNILYIYVYIYIYIYIYICKMELFTIIVNGFRLDSPLDFYIL